jgi:hypothetical protein
MAHCLRRIYRLEGEWCQARGSKQHREPELLTGIDCFSAIKQNRAKKGARKIWLTEAQVNVPKRRRRRFKFFAKLAIIAKSGVPRRECSVKWSSSLALRAETDAISIKRSWASIMGKQPRPCLLHSCALNQNFRFALIVRLSAAASVQGSDLHGARSVRSVGPRHR